MLSDMSIKNVIFDVGNVLVKWAPHEVIARIFPSYDPKVFYQEIRPTWLGLNLGKLTEKEAIALYAKQFKLPESQFLVFMKELKTHQVPIPGSLDLLKKLKALGMNLYSITDNIKEIMEYHRAHSQFIPYFKDIIVSADIGILKPHREIYQHLLNKHKIVAAESVFIDDALINVKGARAVGMHAIQFFDAVSCEQELRRLGIET